MRTIRADELSTYELHNASVVLGTFDALHRGHRAVIRAALDYARKNGLCAVVYLFRVPPKAVFQGDRKCVNSLEKRLEILEELGVHITIVEDFDLEYAQMSCEEFVRFLKEKLRAQAVYVGFNYHFGRDGKGNAHELTRLCNANGLRCEIIPGVEEDGVVSSSRIRTLIEAGDMEKANRLLCRHFSVSGKVLHDRQFGRKIGFPTANMEIPNDLIMPADGVYACRVTLGGRGYPAITNIGSKPTVSVDGRNIETHIIGWEGDLYGKTIEVEFFRRLRGIVKFASAEDLKHQLQTDKQAASALCEAECAAEKTERADGM